MEEHPGKERVQAEGEHGEAINVGDVPHLVGGQAAEPNPPKDQGESDRHGQQAPPEDQLVHPPAHRRAMSDKRLAKEVAHRQAAESAEALKDALRAEKLPAAPPVHAGGRLVEPHHVVIHHAPGGEDDGESVDHQRRIEVLQIT